MKIKMRRSIFAISLIMVLVLSLCACEKKDGTGRSEKNQTLSSF